MQNHNIIPHPKETKIYKKNIAVKPYYKCENPLFLEAVHAFSEFSDKIHELAVSPGEDGIVIKEDTSIATEAYKIEVDDKCIIYVSDTKGLNYAFATLLQIIEKVDGEKPEYNYFNAPKCKIYDHPEGTWRGLMVDVARKWHPTAFLFKYVDICYMLKLNRLQIHFTDDESFTLPCDSFPLLTTENRHYTKAELAVFNEYAKMRGITIVPEVDMPGHCTQFIEKYPDIFGAHGILEASEETFSALEKVYKEVMELFPDSPYIHVGGDEAVLGRWTDCKTSMEYMKKNNIKDIVELYGHYVARITNFILSCGKTPVVWEGFHKETNHLISRDVIVISWENLYQPVTDLAEAGFTLLNCSWQPLYIVAPWTHWEASEILNWDTHMWTHYNEQSAAYNKELRIPENTTVLGGQVCAWGDYLKNYLSGQWASKEEIKCIKPRVAALSEKTWNLKGIHTQKSFKESFEELDKKFINMGC